MSSRVVLRPLQSRASVLAPCTQAKKASRARGVAPVSPGTLHRSAASKLASRWYRAAGGSPVSADELYVTDCGVFERRDAD